MELSHLYPDVGTAGCTPACGAATTAINWQALPLTLGLGANLITVTAHESPAPSVTADRDLHATTGRARLYALCLPGWRRYRALARLALDHCRVDGQTARTRQHALSGRWHVYWGKQYDLPPVTVDGPGRSR